MKKILKNTLTGLCITAITLLLMLAVLEVAYRYQWVDFYASELRQLNRHEDLNSNKKKILVFGDSFSAQQGSYVNLLRDSLKDYSIINCAVSGTSMREMSLIAKRRIDEFKPNKIVVQLYAGNDLTDISHPYNFTTVSVGRNLYWMASDACYSLAWLNYKLAPLRKLFDNEQRFISPSGNDTFSVQGYAGRVKLLLKADNRFIERSALLLNEKYEKSFNRTVGYINAINTCYHAVKPDGKLLVLIIPHCSRVNDRYKADYEKLGAQFRDKGDHPSWGFLMGVLCKFNAQSLLSVSHYLNMAEEQGIQTYYYSDEHLTANGQKVVCSAVLNHLP